jgi:hypothetical protein
MRKLRRMFYKGWSFYKENEWQVQVVLILMAISFCIGMAVGGNGVAARFGIVL